MEFANTQHANDELKYKKSRLALNNQMINLIEKRRDDSERFIKVMRENYQKNLSSDVANPVIVKTRAFVKDLNKYITELKDENKIVESDIEKIKDWIDKESEV